MSDVPPMTEEDVAASKNGRLYVEFVCPKCSKTHPVHIWVKDYLQFMEVGTSPLRPPCPDCRAPSVLPGKPKIFMAVDGGVGPPASIRPYEQPEVPIPFSPPKRFA